MTTMRERLAAMCPYPNLSSATLSPDVALRFAEAEVKRALQPRAPSPELAEAEQDVSDLVSSGPSPACKVVLDELDRLRALVAHLQEELRHRTIDTNIHATHVDSMRGERDIWRTRAKAAESELASLQSAASKCEGITAIVRESNAAVKSIPTPSHAIVELRAREVKP